MLSCVCNTVLYCNKECQKKDWKTHKKNCLPYVVKEVEGKGRGMFATRDIAQAEVILIDKPVLTMEADVNQNIVKGMEKLLEDYLKLPSKVQEDIKKLYNAYGKHTSSMATKVYGIFNTNATRHVVLGETQRDQLYLKISGFNHSCNPNIAWVASLNSSIMTVKALVAIKKGEELVKDYMWSPFGDRGRYGLCREERRAIIKKQFNFDCACDVCSKDDKEDDELRKEYQALDIMLGIDGLEDDGSSDNLFNAEKKLKIGRKISNQLLFRDLVDCQKAIIAYMLTGTYDPLLAGMLTRFTDFGSNNNGQPKELRLRLKEVVTELGRIRCCYQEMDDAETNKLEAMIHALDV